jgi:Mg-chelatase subunit ChlD
MKTIILSIFLLFGGIKGYSQCAKIDILLVADLSSSVTDYQGYIHDALYGFTERFALDKENGIQIGLITFNSISEVLYPLGDDKDKLIQQIHTIKSYKPCCTTDLVEALDDCMEEFNNRGRRDALKIVILISDGSFDYPEEAQTRAKACKFMFNSLIFGVLINGGSSNPNAMREISSPDCFLSVNYENLAEEIRKLDICI